MNILTESEFLFALHHCEIEDKDTPKEKCFEIYQKWFEDNEELYKRWKIVYHHYLDYVYCKKGLQ